VTFASVVIARAVFRAPSIDAAGRHNVFGGDHSVATFLTYLAAAMLIAFVLPEP